MSGATFKYDTLADVKARIRSKAEAEGLSVKDYLALSTAANSIKKPRGSDIDLFIRGLSRGVPGANYLYEKLGVERSGGAEIAGEVGGTVGAAFASGSGAKALWDKLPVLFRSSPFWRMLGGAAEGALFETAVSDKPLDIDAAKLIGAGAGGALASKLLGKTLKFARGGGKKVPVSSLSLGDKLKTERNAVKSFFGRAEENPITDPSRLLPERTIGSPEDVAKIYGETPPIVKPEGIKLSKGGTKTKGGNVTPAENKTLTQFLSGLKTNKATSGIKLSKGGAKAKGGSVTPAEGYINILKSGSAIGLSAAAADQTFRTIPQPDGSVIIETDLNNYQTIK